MPRLAKNRLFNQLLHDVHLSFKGKWRNMIYQIYGHEGLVPASDTADIAHCIVFNVDFYRLHTLQWRHLALRKLLNPFKWVESLIVIPLELFAWCFARSTTFILAHRVRLINQLKPKQNTSALLNLNAFLRGLMFIIYPIVNIAVNLVTGVLRRVLAPVRYLIRPAIETARAYPKSFLTIVLFTLMVAIALSVGIITGGLPLFLSPVFVFLNSLSLKLALVGTMSIALGSVLTKGFNAIRESIIAFKQHPSKDDQIYQAMQRDQSVDYPLRVISTQDDKSDLIIPDDLYKKSAILFRIEPPKSTVRYAIYGRNRDGVFKLNKPHHDKNYDSLDSVKAPYPEIDWKKYSAECKRKTYLTIYKQYGHCPKKEGMSGKVTVTHHNIDDHVDVGPPEKQDKWCTIALALGMESFFYHRETPINLEEPSEKFDYPTAEYDLEVKCGA